MTERQSIGVFSWNRDTLLKAVAGFEATGAHVTGYEIPKMAGYEFVKHDKLVFCEYAPDVLDAWKSKAEAVGMKLPAEIDMPKTPRGFGEPMKEPEKVPLGVAIKTDEKVAGKPAEDKPAPAKHSKKTG